MARQIKRAPQHEDETDVEIPEYRMPGAPPKNPKDKLGQPLRMLVTDDCKNYVVDVAHGQGLELTTMLRLAVALYLKRIHKWDEISEDATWDELKNSGLL